MDTKKLRQKILDLAIHGKLVPQDPNDEPASVLLERIRAGKERLIKEGKIKRSKKPASDTPPYGNEVPFEVPAGWVWVRLDSIGDIVTGSTPPKDNKEFYGGHVSFYKPTDLEQGINTITSTDSLTEEGFAVARQLPIYSILVTCIGATIGKTGMIRKAGTCNQQINAIIPLPSVYPGYIYYVCISDFMQFCIKNNASATTLPILNKNHFAELQIPLAPLEEQKRIVTAIEKWCTLIDSLETAKEDMQTSIAQAKCKILDLAIHGKLVPQDPNDEPAIELLKRSNPAFVPCDNAHYPFDVPNTWIWAKGLDIFKPMKTTSPLGDTFKYIDIDAIDNKRNVITSVKVLNTKQAPSRASRYTEKGCVLFSMVRPYLRNIAMVTEDDCIASTGFFVCHGDDCLLPKFCYFIMLSNYVVDGLNDFMKGDNSPSITKTQIEEYRFPLPPFNEQLRIVAKIEELFAVLDEIEKSIEA